MEDATRATWAHSSKPLSPPQNKKDKSKLQQQEAAIKNYFANSILIKKQKKRKENQVAGSASAVEKTVPQGSLLTRKNSFFKVSTRHSSQSRENSAKKNNQKSKPVDEPSTQIEDIESFFWNQVSHSLNSQDQGIPQQSLIDDLKLVNTEYENDRSFWKTQINQRNGYNNSRWVSDKGRALNKVGDLLIDQAVLAPGYVRAVLAGKKTVTSKKGSEISLIRSLNASRQKRTADGQPPDSSPRSSHHSRSSRQKTSDSPRRSQLGRLRAWSAGPSKSRLNTDFDNQREKHSLLKVIKTHQKSLNLKKFFNQKATSLPKDPSGKPKGLFGLVRRIEALENKAKTFTDEVNQEIAQTTIVPKIHDVQNTLEELKLGDLDYKDKRRDMCRKLLGKQRPAGKQEQQAVKPPKLEESLLFKCNSDLAISAHRPKMSPHLRRLMRLSTSMFGGMPSSKLDANTVNQMVQKSKIFADLGKSLPSGSLVSAAAQLPETQQ